MIARVGQSVPLETSAQSNVDNSTEREGESHSSSENILLIVSNSPQGRCLSEILSNAGYGVRMVSDLPPGLQFPLEGIQAAILSSSWLQCRTDRVCEICLA